MTAVRPVFVDEIFGTLPLVLRTQALTDITEGTREGQSQQIE